ncbi:hypothetical protein ACFVWN_01090 [Nocardiopsis flavescens]|uniref:phage tail protein n=1 Tax=Nocardiopsis flavescens TaxID=758803 RepID=UPI0036612FBF
MGVKIAEGFVEVTSRTDPARTKRQAIRSGAESGGWFARTFGRSASKGLNRETGRWGSIFTKSGTRAGTGFIGLATRSLLAGRKRTDAAARTAGTSAGTVFGDGVVRGADGRLRNSKGQFVAMGSRDGTLYGTGFTRGADGRLRDAKWRFASALGDDSASHRSGRRFGLGWIGGAGSSITSGMGGLVKSVGSGFKSIGVMPWVVVAIVAAAMATLPLIGAATATALVLAFGAGLAGIGFLAAAQSEQVKSAFSGLKDHVVTEMTAISAPLRGTLVDVAGDLRDLFDALSPQLEQAFEDMSPVLSRFSGHLFGAFQGDGFLTSATGAFTALLDSLGPQLDGAFGRMGAALSDMFGVVEANPDVFAGIIIGLLDAVTGLVKFVTWLSEAYVWIQTKLPGGMLTLMSPLGGLAAHFLTTGEAGSKLGEKAAEMGDAFRRAWGFITSSAEYAAEKVLPIVQDIRDRLADSSILDTLSGWWSQIAEIVTLGGEVIGVIMRRVADVLSWVWTHFGDRIIGIFSGLWTIVSGIIAGAFEIIKGLFNVFIGVFTGDWKRAWDGIKQIFGGLWAAVVGILQGAWAVISNIVMGIVNGVVGFFTWLWNRLVGNSIIPEMVTAILNWFRGLRDRGVAFFVQIRDWIVARVIGMRDRSVAAVLSLRDRSLSFLVSLRDRSVAIAGALHDMIVARVSALRDRIVNRFNSIRDNAISAFTKAKDGIASVWRKIETATKNPVNFVIGTVYSNGIKKFWDSIAGKLNMSKLPAIAKLATGGRTSGGVPGKDSIPAMLMADEFVIKRDSARRIGYDALDHMNRTGTLPVQVFARGGIVGAVNGFIDKSKKFFEDGFMSAVKSVTRPIREEMHNRYGSSGFKGLPTKAVDHLTRKLESWLAPFEDSMSGGNGKKVVEVAEKYVGTRGNPNKWTRRMGMNHLPWCGMFIDGVFHEANAGKALASVANPAAVRSYRTLPRVSRENALPGDLPLYRADDGHINIFTGKGTTTIGGNESNSVRKQGGYMLSASSIRRPKFADGGAVEALVRQDDRETGDMQTPLKIRLLREVMAGTPWAHGTHDGGGILLDGAAAANRSGKAEVVTTLEQLKALVAAGKGATYIFEEGAITIDASKLKDIAELLDLIDSLQVTARRHGARTRVGAPR